MKKYIVVFAAFFGYVIYAQESVKITELEQKIESLDKHNENLNIYFNFQSSFDVQNIEDETEVGFKARQLRLEIRGNLTDKLFYRFRHRLNRNNTAQSLDNLSRATDIMYAGYNFSDKVTFIAGKQSQAWGGFEFDLNPMNIYEYSDFIDYMDNFMLGADLIVKPVDNHEVHFQVTDTRNARFEDIYGDLSSQGIEASNSPLTYILNWNGNFLDNKLQTRWAYGIQTQAKDKYSKMITLGNKINLNNFQVALDYMHADEDIDRLGIATNEGMPYLAATGAKVFEDVNYDTYILKAEYQPSENWNIFLKGSYETSSVKNVENYDDDFRKSYGYFGGLEYMPFQGQDLRVFLAYIGRKYEYNENLAYLKDYDTNRVSIGMMYRIKAY
ncbi:porin [Flavobacteriaceae bacterium Ap0902]|nr:porin [Flavobacteriaceae bacterium Ap0902]